MSVLDEVLHPGNIAGLELRRAGVQIPNINMLLYGQYGVGKTLLAGSSDAVPSLRKVLYLDIEGGTLTLRHKYPEVECLRITQWNQLADVYDELRAGMHKDYRTVVVDSLTEAQGFNLDTIMLQMLQQTGEEGKERDPDVAGLLEWQKNQKQIKKFIRYFRDLPITVIFTALEKTDKDKTTGKIRILPDLPGKLAGQVPAMFDEVLYYYMKRVPIEGTNDSKEVRLLLTGATEKIAAKDRSGRLPTIIQEPTMKMLYDLMIGESK